VDNKTLRPRATRVHFAIPVVINGSNEASAPFQEVTQTVAINANGCLIELSTPVIKEQALLLKNMKTNEEMPCFVVTFATVQNAKPQVGLRFAQSAPRFWGLAFPPEDWDPADRKRPTPSRR
jgi:hypothetical protein